jgi:hypothetical protein
VEKIDLERYTKLSLTLEANFHIFKMRERERERERERDIEENIWI